MNPSKIQKILIANRGEIACRIIHTCQKLGIKTVAVYSDEDENSHHVFLADESVMIGPAAPSESYLSIDKIVAVAKQTNADAIHPGFGFLSENANFVKRLEKEKITFIGPREEAVQVMGDKITSKKLAEKSGVPCIPGHTAEIEDAAEAKKIADGIGYPVMIKASAGGGGKGMRVVYKAEELDMAFNSARNEAISSFGDGRVFIEKFIVQPKHIEIQVLFDEHGNAIYLNERECSVQRRNQKVIEESPAHVVTPEIRKAMGESSLLLGKAVDYRGVGTVEYIMDEGKNFYFLEMNTRLQVEHPVTEMTTGVDLVEQQIYVAQGERLQLSQEDVAPKGWAMEARIYSEDPRNDFLPSIGTISHYREPEEDGVRIDSGVTGGNKVSMFYDPMLAKLIVWDEDREKARLKLKKALQHYEIGGVTVNNDFLLHILDNPEFIDGSFSTGLIQQAYPEGFDQIQMNEQEFQLAGGLVAWNHLNCKHFPLHQDGEGSVIVKSGEEEIKVRCVKKGNDCTLSFLDQTVSLGYEGLRFERWKTLTLNGKTEVVQIFQEGQGREYTVNRNGLLANFKVYTEHEFPFLQYMPKPVAAEDIQEIVSPMPGKVIKVFAKSGEPLKKGQPLAILEAMKMENPIFILKDEVVREVHVQEGDTVESGDLLFQLGEDS